MGKAHSDGDKVADAVTGEKIVVGKTINVETLNVGSGRVAVLVIAGLVLAGLFALFAIYEGQVSEKQPGTSVLGWRDNIRVRLIPESYNQTRKVPVNTSVRVVVEGLPAPGEITWSDAKNGKLNRLTGHHVIYTGRDLGWESLIATVVVNGEKTTKPIDFAVAEPATSGIEDP